MGNVFCTGSRAEGLALVTGWGHPETDADIMCITGGKLGVHMPKSDAGNSCLLYRPEGCPPGYTKLEVIKPASLRKLFVFRVSVDTACIEIFGGSAWLNTCNLQSNILATASKSPVLPATRAKGPAFQAAEGYMEYVPALVANAPPPAMLEYLHRIREGWPSQEQLSEIVQMPMLLVLTGHKKSQDKDYEARISCSIAEMKLISKVQKSSRVSSLVNMFLNVFCPICMVKTN